MFNLKISILPVRGGMQAKALTDEEAAGVYHTSSSPTSYLSLEVNANMLDWVRKTTETDTRQAICLPPKLHVTMRLVEGEFDVGINSFLARPPSIVTTKYQYQGKDGTSWLSCVLNESDKKVFDIHASVPHMSLAKPSSTTWTSIGPQAKRTEELTDWGPSTQNSVGRKRFHGDKATSNGAPHSCGAHVPRLRDFVSHDDVRGGSR